MKRLFTQADVTRACRGVIAAGLTVSGVSINRNGDIQVLTFATDTADLKDHSPQSEDGLDRWAREYATRYARRTESERETR